MTSEDIKHQLIIIIIVAGLKRSQDIREGRSVAGRKRSQDIREGRSAAGLKRSQDIREGRSAAGLIVQELCESRGGRPGLSVLTSLLVSVDVKIYCISALVTPCFGIGHNLSLICQLTSEDIKHQLIIITAFFGCKKTDNKKQKPGFLLQCQYWKWTALAGYQFTELMKILGQ